MAVSGKDLIPLAATVLYEAIVCKDGILDHLDVDDANAMQETVSNALSTGMQHAGMFSPNAWSSLQKIVDYRIGTLSTRERDQLQRMFSLLLLKITHSPKNAFLKVLEKIAATVQQRYALPDGEM